MTRVSRMRLCMGCGESLQGRYGQPGETDPTDGAGASGDKAQKRVIEEQQRAMRRRSAQKR